MAWKSFEWPSLASKKCEKLEHNGMKPVGLILAGDHGIRATVDRFGRVQWFEVDGSGKMITPSSNG